MEMFCTWDNLWIYHVKTLPITLKIAQMIEKASRHNLNSLLRGARHEQLKSKTPRTFPMEGPAAVLLWTAAHGGYTFMWRPQKLTDSCPCDQWPWLSQGKPKKKIIKFGLLLGKWQQFPYHQNCCFCGRSAKSSPKNPPGAMFWVP